MNEAQLLEEVGKVAGIGGLALGVFLLLFREVIRKSIFPTLKKDDAFRLLRLIVVLVWSIGIAGIGAWAWGESRSGAATAGGSVSSEGDCSSVVVGTEGNVTINSDCPKEGAEGTQ